MLAKRPSLLVLDGLSDEQAYLRAREEFANVLLSHPVIDAMGRRVSFTFGHRGGPQSASYCQPLDPPRFDDHGRLKDDCWHVCFKQASGVWDPHNKQPRDRFVRPRAQRIPWILPALTDSDTRIHECPERGDPDRQSYSLWVPGDTRDGVPQEFFAVIVRRLPDPREVALITAYALDGQKEVENLRKRGPQIYPAKIKAGAKGKKGRK